MSLSGVELTQTQSNFEIRTGFQTLSTSNATETGGTLSHDCSSMTAQPSNIRDFLKANSFSYTFFHQLNNLLPDSLSLHPTGTDLLELNKMFTSLQKGSQIQTGECQGAPLYPDHLYSVFKFGSGLNISLYG